MARPIADPSIDSDILPIFKELDEQEKLRLADIALRKKEQAKVRAKAAYHKERPKRINRARRDRALLRLAAEWYERQARKAALPGRRGESDPTGSDNGG